MRIHVPPPTPKPYALRLAEQGDPICMESPDSLDQVEWWWAGPISGWTRSHLPADPERWRSTDRLAYDQVAAAVAAYRAIGWKLVELNTVRL